MKETNNNMAQAFFERADFDIAMFCAIFQGVYDMLYNHVDDTPCKLVKRGYALLCAERTRSLQIALFDYRNDFLSSDREVAAFAVAYGIYERRYNGK